MADQEVLPGAPDPGGIWRRYLDHGDINHAAWLRARAEGLPVGTCRRCSDNLMPETPVDRHGGTDYEATCVGKLQRRLANGTSVECGYVLLAPGGRIIRGSSAAWSSHNGPSRVAAIAREAREATS